MSNFLYTAGSFIVVLGVLVFVHELGHYWAAKAFGVWVHRFSIGIGSPIPGLTFQRGETEWAVSWFPLGGYVKMASREEDPASSVLEGGTSVSVPADRVFEAKPLWQRMIIILAGVTLNFVFALTVFTGLAWKNGRNFDPTTTVGGVDEATLPAEAAALKGLPSGSRIVSVDGVTVHTWDEITAGIANGATNEIVIAFADGHSITIPLHRDALIERMKTATAMTPMHPAVIGTLTQGAPAQSAGLMLGDSIVAVNGTSVSQWADLVEKIKSSAGQPMALGVYRGGAPQTITVTPRAEREVLGDESSPMIGRIGVGARVPYLSEPLGFLPAVREGASATLTAATSIYRTFRGLVSGRVSRKEVGGPILIGQMAAESARAGLSTFLAFMALISTNLAVVNLLPVPVLDGGAFVLLAIEGVIRRPLPARVREVVSIIGFLLVATLMVTAFWNDIARLLGR